MGLANFEIKTRRSQQKEAATMNMTCGRRAQQSKNSSKHETYDVAKPDFLDCFVAPFSCPQKDNLRSYSPPFSCKEVVVLRGFDCQNIVMGVIVRMRVERKNEQKTQTEIGKRNKSKYIVSDLNLLPQCLQNSPSSYQGLFYILYVFMVLYLFLSFE